MTWPRYNMIIDGAPRWLSLRDAGIAYDSGHCSISIGGLVLEENGSTRDITMDERRRISDIADDWSASK